MRRGEVASGRQAIGTPRADGISPRK